METIKVPEEKGPRTELCWKQPPLTSVDPNPMVHCDRRIGHGGRHSWEFSYEEVEPVIQSAVPLITRDSLVRAGKYLRTIDGDTFVMLIDLWAPTRVKPAPSLETHIRVYGWNAAELKEPDGQAMREEFEHLLMNAKHIDVYPTGMNRERVVCHVWLDGMLFKGLLEVALRDRRAHHEK